jgi:hypothetical protein
MRAVTAKGLLRRILDRQQTFGERCQEKKSRTYNGSHELRRDAETPKNKIQFQESFSLSEFIKERVTEERHLSGKKSARGAALSTSASLIRWKIMGSGIGC